MFFSNPSAFFQSNFVNTINSHISLFISTNVDLALAVAVATIWETRNAYLRGQEISYSAYQRRIAVEKGTYLYSATSAQQTKCIDSHDVDPFKELLINKAEFHILASNEATKSLLKTRHNYYEFGDKPNRLLNHQIRQSSSFLHITNTTNGTTINPQTIDDKFRDFYSLLYTSESSSDEAQFELFWVLKHPLH